MSDTKNAIDRAIDAVVDLMDGLNLFATVKRGALGTGVYLACEIAPSTPQEVYFDKGAYIPLTLALNGKHHSQETLSEAMNTIQDTLARQTSYPSGEGFEIVDISRGVLPRIIGRENNNDFVMSCDLVVKIYRKE